MPLGLSPGIGASSLAKSSVLGDAIDRILYPPYSSAAGRIGDGSQGCCILCHDACAVLGDYKAMGQGSKGCGTGRRIDKMTAGGHHASKPASLADGRNRLCGDVSTGVAAAGAVDPQLPALSHRAGKLDAGPVYLPGEAATRTGAVSGG